MIVDLLRSAQYIHRVSVDFRKLQIERFVSRCERVHECRKKKANNNK